MKYQRAERFNPVFLLFDLPAPLRKCMIISSDYKNKFIEYMVPGTGFKKNLIRIHPISVPKGNFFPPVKGICVPDERTEKQRIFT